MHCLVCWSAGVTLAPPGRGQILGTDGPSMGRGEVKSRGSSGSRFELFLPGAVGGGGGGAARQSFVQFTVPRVVGWTRAGRLADWQIADLTGRRPRSSVIPHWVGGRCWYAMVGCSFLMDQGTRYRQTWLLK